MDERNLVAWIQPPEPNRVFSALVNEQTAGACSVLGVEPEEFAQFASSTRAVIIPVVSYAGFEQRVQAVLDAAAMYGVHAIFMLQTKSTEATPPTADEVTSFDNAVARLRRKAGQFYRFMENRWPAAVALVCGLQIEAPANVHLVFDGDQPGDDECKALLQRAYHECGTVYLRRLGAGRSSAETWRVAMNARDAVQTSTEFIAKIESSDNSREKSGFAIIADAIPSRLYAPMVDVRAKEGLSRNLVVYRFISRSEPLLERLAQEETGLVESLLNHTFEHFHQPLTTEYEKLGQLFESLGFLRTSDELNEVATEATRSGAPDLATIRGQILKLPPVECILSKIHGDLHAGNLFVHVNTKDVAVIDYATVRLSGPRIWDAACLEVSLAFPAEFIMPAAWPELPSEKALRFLFTYPLTDEDIDSADGLMPAVLAEIKAIRTCVRTREDRAAYAIAVAVALLRFASFDDNGDRARRVVAYHIACDLIQAADSDLRARYAPKH